MRYPSLEFCLPCLLMLAAPAAKADVDASRTAWDSAYEALLANPSDAALNQKYLELCIARKDYEAAIPPLERLLAHEPNNPALMLQLGQMYQLLGSKKVAQGYFAQVIVNPQATDELRAQANSLSQ